MSKANHNFVLTEKTENSRIYKDGKTVVRLDFVAENILRTAVYKENQGLLPTFCINPDNEFSMTGRERLSTDGFKMFSPVAEKTETGESFKLANGITVKVNTGEFALSYYKDNHLLFTDRQPYPYNFENEFGSSPVHYVSRQNGEKIFGLGDKGGRLNKAGRAFRIETSDSMGYNAETTDVLYKHIPFYICENSVGSYGIFYDTSATSYMDLGNEINNYYDPYKYFKTQDNALVYYVFFGSKLNILKSFSGLCGKQAFPPKWSFDYCASTMAYTDAEDSENQMNLFLEKLKKYDLSCGGFYLSSGYTSIGKGRYVFNWNTNKFPNPKQFVKNFNENGIKLIPNIKPAFLLSHPMYDDIAGQGLFVKNQNGTPFVTRFWDGNGSYLDFTNEKTRAFWKKQVKEKLLDYEIEATWNDNNEFDIKDTEAVVQGFGRESVSANQILSQLTQLMVMSSYQAQTEQYPEKRAFLSTRSGGIGIRRYAQTWSGDNRTAFEDLRYCHNIGLTMSLSGLSFYGHDLGGFDGDMPSEELLLRWLQHGVFEPRLTIHSWNKDGSATMPWSYEGIIDSVRQIFAQRKKLMPYLYSSAYRAVETDEPVNSPLFLYYDDESIPTEADCMLFGRDILVPFIFDEGETATQLYLPKQDDWYLGEKLYKGGQTVSLEISAYKPVPYFVKAGSIIPYDKAPYGFKCREQLAFTVYPTENGTFKSEFFADDGVSFEYLKNNCTRLKFTVTCNENQVLVEYENLGKMSVDPDIRLRRGDHRQLIIK